MNLITDNEINNYVQQKWIEIKNKSGIDNQKLMGIFAIGKVCHGFATTLDDMQLVACYVPSFEQLCLNTFPYKYGDKCCGVKMTDFRYIYDLLLQQDITIMECTFTDYKIINDNFKDAFNKYVFINRETLFRYNHELRINNAIKRALDSAHKYYYEDGNIDDLYEACRIRIACELLLSGTSVENCINLKKDYHINYLKQVLNKEITPSYEELKNDLYELQTKAENLIVQEQTIELMEEILFGLYTVGLTKRKDFKKLLTQNEQKAFDIIKQYLTNGEGYISISTLTEKNSISRPVFKNVLQKMKDSKVAEVINKGVKGTFIQVKDFTIL